MRLLCTILFVVADSSGCVVNHSIAVLQVPNRLKKMFIRIRGNNLTSRRCRLVLLMTPLDGEPWRPTGKWRKALLLTWLHLITCDDTVILYRSCNCKDTHPQREETVSTGICTDLSMAGMIGVLIIGTVTKEPRQTSLIQSVTQMETIVNL
jgi:hypothetical protein